MVNEAVLKAGVTSAHGVSPYRGVIRRGREIVWTCPHSHANRDHRTQADWGAGGCAAEVLAAVLGGGEPLRKFERFMGAATAQRYYQDTVRTHQHLQWALEEAKRLLAARPSLGALARAPAPAETARG